MKLWIFLALALCIAPSTQAHFFAYQEWYNPKTGQILEEFYDHHDSLNKDIDPIEHGYALIERARNYQNEVKVIVEDRLSPMQVLMPHIKATSEKTLDLLQAKCENRGIDVVSIDCRLPEKEALIKLSSAELNLTLKASLRNPHLHNIRTIKTFNDCPILNNFYESLEHYSKELAGRSRILFDGVRPSYDEACDSWLNALHVDAMGLHEIHSTKKRRIILAAGSAHLVSINIVLQKLGWQLKKSCISQTFSADDHEQFERMIQPGDMVESLTNLNKVSKNPEFHQLDLKFISGSAKPQQVPPA